MATDLLVLCVNYIFVQYKYIVNNINIVVMFHVITEGFSGICLNTVDAFVITGAGGGLRLWATTLWLCSRVWPLHLHY